MTMFDKSSLMVVFDLDDTLYPERDYMLSGIKSVAASIKHVLGHDIEIELFAYITAGGKDFLTEACRLLALPNVVKDSLLWTYRLHHPDIKLADDVKNLIAQLALDQIPMAIITDGRVLTQQLKLKALGLQNIPAYISEQWQSEKPDTKRFEQLMRDFPQKTYVYVADNPKKDFIAPSKLGWATVQLSVKSHFIHRQPHNQQNGMPADFTIDQLSDLLKYIR